MHKGYVWSGLILMTLEVMFALAWFALMIWTTVNDSGYRQVIFDIVFHFAGTFILYQTIHKLYFKKKIPYVYQMFFGIVAFICARNLVEVWYVLPRLLPQDEFYSTSAALSIIALVMSGIEFLWFMILMSHQAVLKRRMNRKSKQSKEMDDLLTFLVNIPQDVLDKAADILAGGGGGDMNMTLLPKKKGAKNIYY